jgi:hypothetical protein
MLKVIEGDHFTLRREYPERKSLKAALWMIWRVFTSWTHLSGKAGNTRKPSLLKINISSDES